MNEKKMSDMAIGEGGTVLSIQGRGNIQHRLIDMGVVKGTKVSVFKVAPLGDPVEIKMKNFELSLRKNEAAMIMVACEEGREPEND